MKTKNCFEKCFMYCIIEIHPLHSENFRGARLMPEGGFATLTPLVVGQCQRSQDFW